MPEVTVYCANEDHARNVAAVARLAWPDGRYRPTTACATDLRWQVRESIHEGHTVIVEPVDDADPTFAEVVSLRKRAEETELTKVEQQIRDERARQDAKWGPQDCHDFEWVSILTEEGGEALEAYALALGIGLGNVARAANEANFTSGKNRGDFSHLRTEVIQAAAVLVAWAEALDRRNERAS